MQTPKQFFLNPDEVNRIQYISDNLDRALTHLHAILENIKVLSVMENAVLVPIKNHSNEDVT